MPTINKSHKKALEISINKKERNQIYGTIKWRKLRETKLMYSPLCEICLSKGIVKPAIDVHHKDSFMNYQGLDRTYKAYDINNLQSLCKECHSELHKNHTRTKG